MRGSIKTAGLITGGALVALAAAVGPALAEPVPAFAAAAETEAGSAADAGGEAPTTVEELVVTGERGGFAAGAVQAGTFRNARVLDTPLTVNVIPRDVLDAQAAQGLYDALRNTGGVTRSQLNGATYDNVAIRGILVENRGNYRLNGALPVINLVEQPLENKARIEVLKGASGLYYGFVPPSGVINMTTKRAGSRPVTTLALRGDDHGTLIGHLDLGRRFADGDIGVRVNLAGGDVATGVDGVEGDRWLGALALDLEPTDRLSLRFDVERLAKDIAEPAALALPSAVGGVVTLPAIPDSRQNLAGGWARYDAEATNLTGRVDYRFNDRLAAKVEIGRAETLRDRDYSQFQGYDLVTGEGTLRLFQTRGQRYLNENVRAELTGLFETGPLSHELTLGWTWNERNQNGRGNQITNVAQNLYAPRAIAPVAVTTTLATNPSTITDEGLYLFDRVRLGEQWQVIAGLRASDYESVTATTRYTAEESSPLFAVLWQPVESVSLYATYLEGLEEGGTAPANTVNAFEVLPPAKSEQVEVGIKAELFQRFTAALSAFQIERASAFTNSANRFVLDGRVEYRGVEFAGSGEITPAVSVYASALWLDAEQTSASNPLQVGKRPENTPELTLSLFAEWRPEVAPGLALNAGVFHVGDRAVNPLNQAFVGGYETYSAGVRYTRELAGSDTTFQVNVENLTDETYWNAAGNGLLGVGLPRTVKVSISRDL